MLDELIIALLLLLPNYEVQTITKTPNKFAKVVNMDKVITNANNEFAFNIFNTLAKDGNDILSPISILSAFSILMNGANNETLKDLKRFLRYTNSSQEYSQEIINHSFKLIANKYHNENIFKPDVNDSNLTPYEHFNPDKYRHQLNIANKVINSKDLPLLDTFANTVRQYYRADIQTADFVNNGKQETEKVNEWVRNQTNHKIQKIFDTIEPNTSLIIINAIYFKGNWLDSFDKGSTQKLDFYNSGQNGVKVDTMTSRDYLNYLDSNELNAQILELQYTGREISFIIVLPKLRDGLNELKSKINSQNFDKVITSMKRNYVEIFLPKFKTEKSYDLMKEINPKPIALTPKADFSRINREVPQKVTEVIHKTFIAIDEKGTEAAAVTAIKIVPLSAQIHPDPIIFRADHPFLYFIRDKTNGMILFYGQINKF